MRILFLSAWYPYPPDNGSKIRVYHLLRSLCARHAVTLVSFTDSTARPDSTSELAEWCDQVHTVGHPGHDPRAWPHRLRFLSPSPVSTWALAPMTQVARDLAVAKKFDAIVASTESMATYVRHFPPGLAKIMEEHNCFSQMMWERHAASATPAYRVLTRASYEKTRRYERRTMAAFDLVTMVSESDRVACRDMVGHAGPIETVPNGVDCDWHPFKPGTQQEAALIYTGALTYGANLDAMRHFAQAILPQIRLRQPKVFLTITGAHDGVDLTSLADQQGIRLSGYVDDIRPMLRESTVCVVPLRQGGGTRLKILEAMALGTPVVSTTKGAEGLDVVDGKHLLVADDPSEFAEATVRLLRDGALCQHLAQNARRLVEDRYDWSLIGARFTHLIEKTVDAKARKTPLHA